MVIPFSDIPGIGCFWEFVRWGQATAGEYFVSGAIPMAYLAHNNLSSNGIIVKPTFKAKTLNGFTRGDPIS